MKRSVLPFLFFCMFILNAGCGSQPKNVALASDYTVKQETEISINNDNTKRKRLSIPFLSKEKVKENY